MVTYEVETPLALKIVDKESARVLKNARENIICRNLLMVYEHLTLPTLEEIYEEARRLVKAGYRTKKEKRLIFLNRKLKSSFGDTSKLSFVEDSIERFLFLTEGGFMTPKPGNDKSGGRVVDSFALMPSWIRALVKINGRRVQECDYSCLHPNIICTLYGGSQEFLTHDIIAERSGLIKEDVKKEHLSFFNKHPKQLVNELLYPVYRKLEPEMMKKIIDDKFQKVQNEKWIEQGD
jgi:hypothetical protein